ncbi:hypothetical protein ACLB2K_012420 [Fragaria x ananassa]
MGLLEVAASLDPKLVHLVLGLFFGFVLSITSPIVFLLSSYYSDAPRRRRGNRQAYDQLEDIHTILDEELENLSSGKDHHVGDTKYFEELLLKVKDRCDHGLLMLEAKQGRYRALVDEFEKKLKMEKEQVEQRLKMEKQKHREEMHKLEEEMRVLKDKYEAMRWT